MSMRGEALSLFRSCLGSVGIFLTAQPLLSVHFVHNYCTQCAGLSFIVVGQCGLMVWEWDGPSVVKFLLCNGFSVSMTFSSTFSIFACMD